MSMQIDFNFDDYKSDSIKNGRIIKKFFSELSENVFKHADHYYQKHEELTSYVELPLLFGERNLYSIFASSINQITPVHLSEWGFSKNDEKTLDANRRVDFWCLDRNGENGKPINYYIELKKGYYCLNKRSQDEFASCVVNDIDELKKQLKDIKKMKPRFSEVDDAYLGLFVVHGYNSDQSDEYDELDVFENFVDKVSKRERQHVVMSTWTVPVDYKIQWEKDKCRFISLVGIVQD